MDDGLRLLPIFPIECIDGFRNLCFLYIQLDLGGTGKQSEIGMVMKRERIAIAGVVVEMVEQHPIAAVGNGLVSIQLPAGIDAHTGEIMTVLLQLRL